MIQALHPIDVFSNMTALDPDICPSSRADATNLSSGSELPAISKPRGHTGCCFEALMTLEMRHFSIRTFEGWTLNLNSKKCPEEPVLHPTAITQATFNFRSEGGQGAKTSVPTSVLSRRFLNQKSATQDTC